MDIIVVNDGSHDGTAAIASGFGSRVRVITQENGGMSASRNRGIEEGDSEFIALVDSDDIWHPQKIMWQVAAFEAHAEHAYCFTEFNSWDGIACSDFMTQPRTGALEQNLTGSVYHEMALTNWVFNFSTTLPSNILSAHIKYAV